MLVAELWSPKSFVDVMSCGDEGLVFSSIKEIDADHSWEDGGGGNMSQRGVAGAWGKAMGTL